MMSEKTKRYKELTSKLRQIVLAKGDTLNITTNPGIQTSFGDFALIQFAKDTVYVVSITDRNGKTVLHFEDVDDIEYVEDSGDICPECGRVP